MTYVVKAGDTLYGISNQFGVNVNELAELNNIRGSNLKIGQVLKIPTKSGTNPSGMFMYTVRNGDTLYSIAQRYKTTVKAIQELNYLKTINLEVGQVLRIPENYSNTENSLPNYINYTVKKGDSLYSIARANNLTVDEIMRDNNLNNTSLKIGDILKIRVPLEENIVVEECYGVDYVPKESKNTINYIVKKGDTLYSIAKNFNTSETVIKSLNNLTSSNLSIGSSLKIPIIEAKDDQIYIVKSGDSLYSIARKFNKNVDSIKLKNNLTSDILKVGQELKI